MNRNRLCIWRVRSVREVQKKYIRWRRTYGDHHLYYLYYIYTLMRYANSLRWRRPSSILLTSLPTAFSVPIVKEGHLKHIEMLCSFISFLCRASSAPSAPSRQHIGHIHAYTMYVSFLYVTVTAWLISSLSYLGRLLVFARHLCLWKRRAVSCTDYRIFFLSFSLDTRGIIVHDLILGRFPTHSWVHHYSILIAHTALYACVTSLKEVKGQYSPYLTLILR